MIQFVSYFFPAVLALKFDREYGKPIDFLNLMIMYVSYVVAINGTVYAVLYLFTAHRYRFFTMAHFNVSFALQYIIMSVILARTIPMVTEFLRSHFSMSVKMTRK